MDNNNSSNHSVDATSGGSLRERLASVRAAVSSPQTVSTISTGYANFLGANISALDKLASQLASLRIIGSPSRAETEPVQAAAPPAVVVQVPGPDTSLDTIEAVGAKKSSGFPTGATFNPRREDNVAAAPFGDDATLHGKVTPTSSTVTVDGDITSPAASLPASLPSLASPSAFVGEERKPFAKRFPNASGYDHSAGVRTVSEDLGLGPDPLVARTMWESLYPNKPFMFPVIDPHDEKERLKVEKERLDEFGRMKVDCANSVDNRRPTTPVVSPKKHLSTPTRREDVTAPMALPCRQFMGDDDASRAARQSQVDRIMGLNARIAQIEAENLAKMERKLTAHLQELEDARLQELEDARDEQATTGMPLPAVREDDGLASEEGVVESDAYDYDASFLEKDDGLMAPARQTGGVLDGATAPVPTVFGFSGDTPSRGLSAASRAHLQTTPPRNYAAAPVLCPLAGTDTSLDDLQAAQGALGSTVPKVLFRNKKGTTFTLLTPAESARLYGNGDDSFVKDFSSVGVKYPKGERKKVRQTGYTEEKAILVRGLSQRIGTHSFAVTDTSEKGNLKDGTSDIEAFQKRAELVKDLVLAGQVRDYISCIYTVPVVRSKALKKQYTDLELASIDLTELIDSEAEPYYLPDDYGHVPVDVVALWQRVLSVYNTNVHPEDCRSSSLCYQMIQNSVTHDFQRELDAMMLASGFEDSQKGGVTLLLCLLKTLFATPQSKIDTLRAELVKFGKEGYKKTSGENVVLKNKQVRNIVTILEQCGAANPDIITTVLKGLNQCSVKTFSENFGSLYREKLREKAAVNRSLRQASQMDPNNIFSTIRDMLTQADNLYESLCIDGEWVNSAGKDVRAFTVAPAVRVVICWNCGKQHHLKDCKEPKNAQRIAAEKEKYEAAKEKEKGGSKNDKNSDKKVPKSEIPSRDSSGNVKEPKFNPSTRKFEVHCRVCAKYTNHSARFHRLAEKKGAAFNLADESPQHPAVIAQQKFDASEPPTAPTATTPGSSGADVPRVTTAEIRAHNISMKKLVEQVQRGGNDQLTRDALVALAAKQQEFAQNFV